MPIKLSTSSSKEGHKVKITVVEPSQLRDMSALQLMGDYVYEYELVNRFMSKDRCYYIYEALRIPTLRKVHTEQDLNLEELSYDVLKPKLGIGLIEFD